MVTLLKEIKYQIRWGLPVWAIRIITAWWPDNHLANRFRGFMHRPFLRRCGKNLQVSRGVTLLSSHNIVVGQDVLIAHGAWLNGLGGIFIDDEVVIGPYVVISSLTHCYKDYSFRFGGARDLPVSVGRGTWLGSHVTVLYGVQIGPGCVVAANSLVTKRIPPNRLAVGAPAKTVGTPIAMKPTLKRRADII